MSDTSQGPGWWLASDGRWYPPQSAPAPPPLGSSQGGDQTGGYGGVPAGFGYGGVPGGAGANRGPLGRRESIGLQILFAVVTFGLYGIYWAYKSHEEIKRHSGEGVGGVLGMIIFIFIGFGTLFLLPLEIKRMYEREGLQSPVGAARLLGADVRHPLVREVPVGAERLLG